MASQTAHLSDEELSAARLEIDDPLAMPNLCFERPPNDLAPEIVGEYHLPPDNDFIWCCHCQGHHHLNGFVITNSTGRNYLLGSECGPKHYDVSFKLARREHKAKVRRKGVLDRLKGIVANASVVKAVIREILHSDGLRLVDQKREELRRACDSAFSALATSVATGMPLYEIVTVRDLAAEQQRDAQLPDDQTGPPIYRQELRSLGHVAGAGMLRHKGDCRDVLLGLKGAIERVEALHRGITDNFSIQTLTKAVREAEEAWQAGNDAIIEVEFADAFFTDGNLNRLQRWTATNRYYQLAEDAGTLLVTTSNPSRRTTIASLPKITLPRLPKMKS